jgi:putative ABC transport system permease protein
MRGVPQIHVLFQDVRYAIRTLTKAPAFSCTALAALAVGIGANTAIFSVINTSLLKPVMFPDPGRIVSLFITTREGPSYGGSAAKFNIWRRQTHILQDVSAYEYSGSGLNLTGGSYPERINAIRVSADYFRLFGAPMVAGRGFTSDEDSPGGSLAAILSYGLWQRRFGGDPKMIGKTISLGGAPYTVVGVVGTGFNTELSTPPDIWLPFQIDPASNDHAQYFAVAGRLKPGVTVEMAHEQLHPAAAEFHRRFPNIVGPGDGFGVMRFQDAIVSDVRPSLLMLAGSVALVLLIACANVANLMLIRATGRKREIAIRAAIGARRWHIVRQLLTESVVLSLIGGALGLLLGMVGVRVLLRLNPGDIPRLGEHGAAVSLDWRLAVFAVSISLAAGVLFGLVPALDASRTDVTAALKDGGRSGTGLRQNKIQALLVIGEVALALVLLIGAALLIRTFLALRTVNPGFDANNVLTMRMSLAGSRFRKTSDVNRLVHEAVQRLETLPGVMRAGASYNLPLEGAFGVPFNIVGRPRAADRYDGRGWLGVSPAYFDIFKIPILRGRLFTDRDDLGTAPVAIINQAMARRFWPKGNPLGERLILGSGYGPEFEEPAREIVGIVADVRDSGLNRDPGPLVFVPLAQTTDGITELASRAVSLVWIVRTRVTPRSLAPAIEAELLHAAGGVPVADVRSMDEIVIQSTARADFDMSLLTIFGFSALLLAAIGIYGLMAYSVRLRARELGIRIALGAEMSRVRNMIILQGMRLALIGIAIGVVGAFGLTHLIANLLFGVKPWDPLAFITVPVLLSAVTLLSVWLPAIRATRIDAVQALHSD